MTEDTKELQKIDFNLGGKIYNIVGRGKTDNHANLRNKLTGNMKYDVRISELMASIRKNQNVNPKRKRRARR